MSVYMKVPHAQVIERAGRRPIDIIKWVDAKKTDGRHRSRLVAKEFNNGDQAATPPLEGLKLLTVKLAAPEPELRDTKMAPGDDKSSVMVHADGHRACLYSQAKPNTYVEVPDEDQLEGD